MSVQGPCTAAALSNWPDLQRNSTLPGLRVTRRSVVMSDTCQRRTASPPVTTVAPRGPKATALTAVVAPVRIRTVRPSDASRIRPARNGHPSPVMRKAPSGENAALSTNPAGISALAETTFSPSGAKESLWAGGTALSDVLVLTGRSGNQLALIKIYFDLHNQTCRNFI
jgi:hypothetical protein